MTTARQRHRTLGFAACALASAFWGCGFFFGKVAMAEMSFAHMVLYRFSFAVLALLPLLVRHRPHFSAADWRLLTLTSFLGVPVQFLLQFYGLSMTTVSHAALMVGLMPVLVAVGAAIFAHERLDPIGWAALAASTSGAALIALGGRAGSHVAGQPSLKGDLMVVLSLLVGLAWILQNKRLIETNSHILITIYGLAIGLVMLWIGIPVVYGLPPVAHVSLKAWLALAGAGVLCTATTTLLWNWGLTQVPASQAGVLLNMEPLLGSLLGVFVLGERLGPSAWIGGVLILGAAITLTTRSRAAVKQEMEEIQVL